MRGRDMEPGLIWIFEPERGFGAAATGHAQLVRERAELALQNAERYGRAKERAFIDDVTEVYNARFLLQATDRENERVRRRSDTLNVSFLSLIEMIVERCERSDTPLSFCGEDAGRPIEALCLAAIGLRTLSMRPASN